MKLPSGYELQLPPQIVFGWGCRSRLPDVLKTLLPERNQPRIYVVSAGSAVRNGVVDELAALGYGTFCGLFNTVPGEPPLAVVNQVIAEVQGTDAEVVLAIGGGSVIDVAKAAAALGSIPGARVEPWFDGSRKITRPGLACVALPTTAGSGAEMTPNSVLTLPAKSIKKSLRSPFLIPGAAIIDPELTLTLSREQTIDSGLDAMTQAIEGFFSIRANAVSSALARKAIGLLFEYLPRACANLKEPGARIGTAEGSMLTGMAFAQSGLGAVHGLAHPIGALLNIPHGRTCAILLPHIMAWNAPVRHEKMEELARAVGLSSADRFLTAITDLCRQLGVPSGFKKYGLNKEHYRHILEHCRSNSMLCNPREMSDSDIRILLERLRGQ